MNPTDLNDGYDKLKYLLNSRCIIETNYVLDPFCNSISSDLSNKNVICRMWSTIIEPICLNQRIDRKLNTFNCGNVWRFCSSKRALVNHRCNRCISLQSLKWLVNKNWLATSPFHAATCTYIAASKTFWENQFWFLPTHRIKSHFYCITLSKFNLKN